MLVTNAMHATNDEEILRNGPRRGEKGVASGILTQSQTTEARNVKFGMQISNAMHVTANEGIFRNCPWRGEKGVASDINAEPKLPKIET